MKYPACALWIAVLWLGAGAARAQQGAAPAEQVYTVVDEMPRFTTADPGPEALLAYLGRNTRYPAGAIRAKATGTVFVGFVVNPQGQVGQVKVVKGAHPTLDAEALRVVQAMPQWQVPGRQQGVPVSVAFTVPVRFNMRMGTLADVRTIAAAQNQRRSAVEKQLADAPAQLTSSPAGRDTAPVFTADPLGALNYINRQVQYPPDALRAKQEGTVLVAFVIDAEGKVTDARITKSVFPSLDAEVLRVVRSLPEWKPGTHEGKPAAVPLSDVPVSFRIK